MRRRQDRESECLGLGGLGDVGIRRGRQRLAGASAETMQADGDPCRGLRPGHLLSEVRPQGVFGGFGGFGGIPRPGGSAWHVALPTDPAEHVLATPLGPAMQRAAASGELRIAQARQPVNLNTILSGQGPSLGGAPFREAPSTAIAFDETEIQIRGCAPPAPAPLPATPLRHGAGCALKHPAFLPNISVELTLDFL